MVAGAVVCGKLKIVAKLGELMPDDRGRPKNGEEKNSAPGAPIFGKHAKAAYRKVAANQDAIPKYFAAAQQATADDEPVALYRVIQQGGHHEKRKCERRASGMVAR